MYPYQFQTKKIALTIDDLPIHGDKIAHCSRLEIAKNFTKAFKKYHLPPVMGFANMKPALECPEGFAVIQHWSESGNMLGNHTFSHMDLEYVSEGAFIADIENNEKYLSDFSNFKRYFRYPFLSESSSFLKRTFLKEYLSSKNYITAPVTIDFYDFMWNTAFSKCLAHKNGTGKEYLKSTFINAAIQCTEQSAGVARDIFSSNISALNIVSAGLGFEERRDSDEGNAENRMFVSEKTKPAETMCRAEIPHVVLLHMGMATSLFIEPLIESLLLLGYQFVSLEEALSDEIYQEDFYTPERNGLNFLQQAAMAHEIQMAQYPEALKKQVLRYAYNLPSTITL